MGEVEFTSGEGGMLEKGAHQKESTFDPNDYIVSRPKGESTKPTEKKEVSQKTESKPAASEQKPNQSGRIETEAKPIWQNRNRS